MTAFRTRAVPALPTALLIAALAGYVTRLAFPAPGWWPLAPVGVALLSLVCVDRSWRQGALLGLVYGLGFFVPLLSWSGIYVGRLPWFALATLQSLYVALLGVTLSVVLRRVRHHPALVTLAVACLWVGQEALRDRTPYGGFPWGRLAFSQAGSPLGHLAAIGGAPLVTFAVAVLGGLITLTVLRLLAAVRAVPGAPEVARIARGRAGILLVAVSAAAVLGAGAAVPLPTDGRAVQVAGIQGDVPEPGLDFNAHRRAVLDNHARVTTQLAADVAAGRSRQPDLVIWPENGSDLDPFRQADARSVIDAAVDAINAPVLVGAVLQQPADHLTNASIAWTPQAGPGAFYAKRHPVPFAEYIPSRGFFRHFSSKVDLVTTDFAPGHAVGVLDLGPARVGIAICFEVAYDDLVRDTVRDGADLLVVQTNNATFGHSDEAAQQLAMSRIRAMEHGRAVAHVSTVGISALISPDGRVLDHSELFEPAALEATLPLRTSLTVADRVGSRPEWVFSALGLALLLLGGPALRAGRRRTSGPQGSDLAPADQTSAARTSEGGPGPAPGRSGGEPQVDAAHAPAGGGA